MTAQSLHPHDHTGLVWFAAQQIAERDNTTVNQHVGSAYIVLCDALRTFRPELGYRVSTHVMKAMRWQLPLRDMKDGGKVRLAKRGADGSYNMRRFFPADPYTFENRTRTGMERRPTTHAEATRALVQLLADEAGEDGHWHPLGWQIMRMLARGMQLKQMALALGMTRHELGKVIMDELCLDVRKYKRAIAHANR